MPGRKKKDMKKVKYGNPKSTFGRPDFLWDQTGLGELQEFPKMPDRIGITFKPTWLNITARNIGKPYTKGLVKVTKENVENLHPKNITTLIEGDLAQLNEEEFTVEKVKMPDNQHKHPVMWYLVRLKDSAYNEITFRIKSWTNFTVIVYINGIRILSRYCDEKGINYKLVDGKHNAFEQIDMSDQKCTYILLRALGSFNLKRLFNNYIRQILPSLSDFYESPYCLPLFNQVEFAYDEILPDNITARRILFDWIGQQRESFPEASVYWDGNVLSFDVSQEPGVRPQFKAYVFGKLLRFELTYNSKHLKKLGCWPDYVGKLYKLADKDFKELAERTCPIKLKRSKPRRKAIKELKKMVNSETDVTFLSALKRGMWGSITNADIRRMSEEIGMEMSRGQVQYRLREKFPDLVEKNKPNGRKWIVKAVVRWIIIHLLEMIDMVSVMFDYVRGEEERRMVSFEFEHVSNERKERTVIEVGLERFGLGR